MTKKIFRSILAITATVLILSFIIITGVLYNHFSKVQKKQLETQLYFAGAGVEINGKEYINKLVSDGYRVTWIDREGDVLFDTNVDESVMENHIDREEIREALETGKGESVRYSATLTEKTMYKAMVLNDGTVLRISAGHDTIWALIGDVMLPFAVVLMVAILLSILLAKHMSAAIVNPLNNLNLDSPLENDTYEELAPLLGRISRQHKQIDQQVAILKEKTDEFDQIISAMNEGLILVDKKGTVLSINKAAQNVFGVNAELIGQNFLKIDHSLQFSRAMEAALDGAHTEYHTQKNGREYQYDISSIESEDKVVGAVLLVFDITEIVNAQRNRQEFTANVSHELKTPLQSIIGSAELLENQLVRHEDIPRFIGHIKTEATRLVTLINDIIRLSQLDENSELPSESIDIYGAAQEVIDELSALAKEKNVTFSLEGEHCTITGIRRYIYEIIYNLCDNAIRYNKDGGTVTVGINVSDKDKNSGAILSVSDTGIGIDTEHHARIFERFYRVDKSHSKETGGTGLGLSIVKHAAVYHGAKLELESEPGVGTTIRVVFK